MIEVTHAVAAAGEAAPGRAILIGGLAGGALDLGFAFTAWALRGVGPADILRGIASGLLGPAARTGFAPVPLGLACHFLLSLLFAAAFVLVAARVAANAARVVVSTLPQTEQVDRVSATACSAASNGSSAASRFFIRCSTARRAERGPRPGSRASAWVSASIWCDAMPGT